MSESGSTAARTWRYRFTTPDDEEIEVSEYSTDEAAEARARALSKAQEIPVKIGRHDHVDWEYVTEVDERP